jgi:Flp pilus assembly protein protease CpaA
MVFDIPVEFVFLFVLALVYFIFATVQDVRFREVANWLSFSFIIFALVYRISYSVFAYDLNFLIQGLFGLCVFVLLGYGLYYGRFFAGGDAKLLMGLGLVLPVYDNFASNFQLFLLFIFLMLFVGAIYGLLFSFIIAIRKNFGNEFLTQKDIFYFRLS